MKKTLLHNFFFATIYTKNTRRILIQCSGCVCLAVNTRGCSTDIFVATTSEHERHLISTLDQNYYAALERTRTIDDTDQLIFVLVIVRS